MDSKTFEIIKQKIEVLKQKKAKAEGAIESILLEWHKNHNIESLEEAEKYIATLQEEIDTLTTKSETIYEELRGLTNWNLI